MYLHRTGIIARSGGWLVSEGDMAASGGWIVVTPQSGDGADGIGFWPLDRLVSGVFEDETGNDNDGLVDNTDWAFHPDGGCANSASELNTIIFPGVVELLPDSFEMCLYFRSATPENRFYYKLPKAGGGWVVSAPVDNLSPDVWHTIEIEYDHLDTEVLMYVDGVLESVQSAVIDWGAFDSLTLNFDKTSEALSPYIRDFTVRDYDPDQFFS